MRTPFIILCLFFCLTACNDSKKNDESEESPARQNESVDNKYDQNTSGEDQNSDQSDTDSTGDLPDGKDSEGNSKNPSPALSGLYIKSDHLEDSSCKCYCIDVKPNGTSELCLTEDKLYINGRFEQSGNNINIYYSGKSSKNTDTEIPWDDFETGTPIAVLSPDGNGLKLDWKGFTINGEIAIDYALYGKKTLEGTYKKK